MGDNENELPEEIRNFIELSKLRYEFLEIVEESDVIVLGKVRKFLPNGDTWIDAMETFKGQVQPDEPFSFSPHFWIRRNTCLPGEWALILARRFPNTSSLPNRLAVPGSLGRMPLVVSHQETYAVCYWNQVDFETTIRCLEITASTNMRSYSNKSSLLTKPRKIEIDPMARLVYWQDLRKMLREKAEQNG